ncbi:MAG: hypothetical protein IJB23_02060 [Alistipes sp.]|nr:hypothetical protein [Alistipes sp.]
MRSVLTILLTSLFWAFVIFLFFEPKSSKEEKSEPTVEVVEAEKPAKPTRTEKKSARTEKRAAKKEAQTKSATAVETPAAEVAEAPMQTPAKTTEEAPAAEAPAQAPAKAAKEATITAEKSSSQEVTIDYAREIDGKWQPIEGAEYPLEFTKYGIAIQHRGYQKRVSYSLKEQRLRIYLDSNARCEITKQGTDYILEIYNSQGFSGKYKRVSQPRKIAMRPLDQSLYAEAILGKWSVINGQEYALEFTKYGTAIQHRGYEKRIEYNLNGSNLRIYLDSSARVTISEDASYYYLEIYNSEDFSGRYRKSK